MKESREILTSITHTAQMGQSGIHAVKDKAVSPGLRQLLQEQLTEYESIEKQSLSLAKARHWELPKRRVILEKMSAGYSRMRLLAGDTDSLIAGMLVQGNTRGMILGIKNLHKSHGLDPTVKELAQTLLNNENINIQKSREFL